MVRFTAAFALASAVALANAAEYKVRVRNLTYLQPFSPPLVVAHTRDVSLFKEGLPASDAIQTMAEDGDNSALLALAASADVAPFICGAAMSEGPLFPGETWRETFEVDTTICGDDAVFSVVAMLINTNDAFMGIDAEGLNEYATVKYYPPAFDAGTEDNNELCAYIPGPACEADSGNLMAPPGEEFIQVHRGVHGIGDISASAYDWRNPVAEVVMFAP